MKNVSSQHVLAILVLVGTEEPLVCQTINSTPTIRQRFLATYEAAFAGELDEWHSTREYLPALIILLIFGRRSSK
jgi:hypothetical protein